MTLSSFLIVLFIFILSGVILIRPFIDQEGADSPATSGRSDVLLAEKERLYSIIEELDGSLELGKISSEDHSRSRAVLLNQAARILEELDKIGEKKSSEEPDSLLRSDDELEKMIQARRETLQSGSLTHCPKCGGQVSEKDQFCSHCGESL